MEININDIHLWLKRLNHLPKKEQRKETLLDIMGIEHLENQWSYIYMYFFDPCGSHGMSRLFVDTLQKIIQDKTGKPLLSMDFFSVVREDAVPDEKGNRKRIDLLLQNEEEAIIIENKVYANLYNRLDLYWDKPNVPNKNKRGVVLSLRKIRPKHSGFICITHEEFAKAIEEELPAYFMSAQPKALILLQDFIQNIYNISHPMNEQEIEFYFQDGNREIINRLVEIRNNVINYIKQSVENDSILLPRFQKEGWNLDVKKKTSARYVYYTFDKASNENVMLTLVYDTVWNYNEHGCRIRMFLELQGEMISFADKHTEELKAIGVVAEPHMHKGNSYWHYMSTNIPLNPQNLIDQEKTVDEIVSVIKSSGFYEKGMKIIQLKNELMK